MREFVTSRALLWRAALLGLVLSCVDAAQAATWYVNQSVPAPGDGTSWDAAFKTIQEGIDAASGGDTVIVADGSYAENIDLRGKDIVLRSTDPLDPQVVSATVMDGGGVSPVVTLRGAEPPSCVIAGFTITDGLNPGGGGISGSGSLATIRNNRIVANRASGGGGLGDCDGLIEDNLVANNEAGTGGGMSGCDGIIRRNRVEDNSAGNGGGLAWCNGRVSDNLIVGNSASYGGGLYGCHGIVERCTIAGNSADNRGGGIDDSRATIQSCIVAGNRAYSGGGLSFCDGVLNGNTVVGNTADFGGGINACDGTVLNCIVWLNASPEGPQVRGAMPRYSCIQGWESGGIGNLALDPLFADLDGPDDTLATWEDNDLRVSAGSPCIDAGANYYWAAWPIRDRDGNCRLAGVSVDIGCYEFASPPDSDGDLLPDADEEAYGADPDRADTDADGLPDGIEMIRGTSPNRPNRPGVLTVPRDFPNIQRAIQVALNGEQIVVEPGTYHENVHFLGRNIVLRSIDPSDPIVVQQTVIDGSKSGSVVSFAGTEQETCILSGLTITNGLARSGGGIYGGPWTLTPECRIETNIIIDNSAYSGGGIYACDGVISRNTISQNAAKSGGGLGVCNGLIENNTIVWNIADYWGGGLDGSTGQVVSNLVYANSVASGAGGGLMGIEGIVCGNVLTHNSAASGAGLYGCYGLIANNTVVANSVDLWGGAVQNCIGDIVNCIVWGNIMTVSGSQLHETSDPVYSCIQDWTGAGEGNINLDPRFVDEEKGDFRLRADSPCIDAGFNSPELPEFDIAGIHRIMFGGKSLTVDMGAYEFYINKLQRVAGTDEAIFTWSSLADKTYSIFYTDDLFNWQTAIENFPSLGNQTTSWLDDGSLTGVPPLLALKRFYRLLQNP